MTMDRRQFLKGMLAGRRRRSSRRAPDAGRSAWQSEPCRAKAHGPALRQHPLRRLQGLCLRLQGSQPPAARIFPGRPHVGHAARSLRQDLNIIKMYSQRQRRSEGPRDRRLRLHEAVRACIASIRRASRPARSPPCARTRSPASSPIIRTLHRLPLLRRGLSVTMCRASSTTRLSRKIVKCELCRHLQEGDNSTRFDYSACAQVCPTGATLYGPVEELHGRGQASDRVEARHSPYRTARQDRRR